MADMSPMAEDLDTNNHSPTGSVGSGGSTGTGIPMLVVHKREMVQIMEDHHQEQQNNHHHGHSMEADDGQHQIDDQDTDGDALSPQKRPLNNNNNDVATVFLIDTSQVGPEDADQAVEVDEVCISIIYVICYRVYTATSYFDLKTSKTILPVYSGGGIPCWLAASLPQ